MSRSRCAMVEMKCEKCGFVCYSIALFSQHSKRCETGLSESDYNTYLRERTNAK